MTKPRVPTVKYTQSSLVCLPPPSFPTVQEVKNAASRCYILPTFGDIHLKQFLIWYNSLTGCDQVCIVITVTSVCSQITSSDSVNLQFRYNQVLYSWISGSGDGVVFCVIYLWIILQPHHYRHSILCSSSKLTGKHYSVVEYDWHMGDRGTNDLWNVKHTWKWQ